MEQGQCVMVTGATGWIGRKVCQSLQTEGHFVVACDLRERSGPWDYFIRIDISEDGRLPSRCSLSGLPQSPNGMVLIHCAGYAHRPIETPEEVRRFFAINAEGTRRAVDWARSIGVKRFLYLSSIAFYDWDNSQDHLPLSETAKVVGRTAYAKSKLDGETYVEKADLDSRIVRLATVFGDGDPANFAKLGRALKRRRFILPGAGAARKSVISVDKAGEWIARFALMEKPAHYMINLGYQSAPTLAEICGAFQRVCGFHKPFSLSETNLRRLARAGDRVEKLKHGFPLTSRNINKLTQSTWVDCTKAAEMIPEISDMTFEGALKDCADFYRSL